MQPLTAVCRRAVLINTVEPVPVRMAVIRNFILTVQIWVTCSVISSGICSMEDPTVVEEVTVSTVMEMVYYSNGSGAGGFGQDGHFGDFGSSGGFGRGQFRQKGSDIHADVTVSFDDAAFGCEKMIHLQDGNGQIQSLKVNIPAGIDTGKTVRLKGKGNPGFNGGEAGDLLLKVTVGDRAGFERKGMDVYTNITIPFTTAVLGGEAVVPTLTGNVVCSIRPGTQSGSKIRLRGKGIVSMKDKNIHGDEYAVVQIQVPKNLNETAKEKLREFAKAC